MMFLERKKISVKDLNIGDMVIGMHSHNYGMLFTIVAGEIKKKSKDKKSNKIIYFVQGNTLQESYDKKIDFSGFLDEDEVEVIDQQMYYEIMELYIVANKQLISGQSHRETAEKINEMRHKSRAELEEKYAVMEAQ